MRNKMPLRRATRDFLEAHPDHKMLWETLEGSVPHWPELLRRRWITGFLPYWRPELLDEARLRRLLTIAMRRGWFDVAHDARRWGAFLELLEQGEAHPHRRDAPAHAINAFNFIAALPGDMLGARELAARAPHAALRGGEGVLDAERLTALIARFLSAEQQGDTPERAALARPELFLVHQGESVHGDARRAEAERFLDLPWQAHGLRLLHVIRPFGRNPWELVSHIGLDARDMLIAYGHPVGSWCELDPEALHAFDGKVVRGEPGELRVPRLMKSALRPVLWESFELPRGARRVALAHDGSVVVFAPIAAERAP